MPYHYCHQPRAFWRNQHAQHAQQNQHEQQNQHAEHHARVAAGFITCTRVWCCRLGMIQRPPRLALCIACTYFVCTGADTVHTNTISCQLACCINIRRLYLGTELLTRLNNHLSARYGVNGGFNHTYNSDEGYRFQMSE